MTVQSFTFARQIFTVLFPGLPDVVDDGNSEICIRPQGTNAQTMHVVGIEIIGTSGIAPAASGNTTARVSLTSLGAGIDATIPDTQRKSSAVTAGSLEFSGGDPLYIHRPVIAGGHVDLQVAVHILMS